MECFKIKKEQFVLSFLLSFGILAFSNWSPKFSHINFEHDGEFFELRSNRLFGGAVLKRYIEDNCQEIKRKMQINGGTHHAHEFPCKLME